MSEIQINGDIFLCGRMNARKQFHVARRLTPIINHLVPLMNGTPMLVNDGTGTMVPSLGNLGIVQAIAAISDTIRELPDADADYVIDTCLDAVKFRSGNSWAPLRAPGSPPGGGLMLGSADRFDTQMRLVGEVLWENLSDFSLETVLPSQTENGQTA
jgi:hypothetical protein